MLNNVILVDIIHKISQWFILMFRSLATTKGVYMNNDVNTFFNISNHIHAKSLSALRIWVSCGSSLVVCIGIIADCDRDSRNRWCCIVKIWNGRRRVSWRSIETEKTMCLLYAHFCIVAPPQILLHKFSWKVVLFGFIYPSSIACGVAWHIDQCFIQTLFRIRKEEIKSAYGSLSPSTAGRAIFGWIWNIGKENFLLSRLDETGHERRRQRRHQRRCATRLKSRDTQRIYDTASRVFAKYCRTGSCLHSTERHIRAAISECGGRAAYHQSGFY